MNWTDDQQKAISAPSGRGNILVSAAAGSGKTAVLVERLIEKLTKGETSIERLLVVTFTEAAASEMKEKIIKSLSAEMEKSGSDKIMLKSQLRMAETADIMTIDAFCYRVVQNNFHILGIEPSIKISDESMNTFIKDEAMETLFGDLYKLDYNTEERKMFSRLLDVYAEKNNDLKLGNIILTLYRFVSSFAEPKKWLDNAAEMYTLEINKMPHVVYMRDCSKSAAEDYIKAHKDVADTDLGDIADELEMTARNILSEETTNGIYEQYKHAKEIFTNGANRINASKDTHAKQMFGLYKDGLENGITLDERTLEAHCNRERLYEEAKDLVWITKKFMYYYEKQKDRYGVREFSDIEQLAYGLFRDHEDIRNDYKNKYDEILIDEYQDTNGLQDALFQMISHDNIFMVGDLKQSIYRFRGGDPYIFKEKSGRYGEYGMTEGDSKIVLSQNFRSRYEILNSVNDVFKCVMSKNAGDVEYVGRELLSRKTDYYPKTNFCNKSEMHFIAVNDGDDTLEAELDFTANEISKLINPKNNIKVFDKDLGDMRPVRLNDIVILASSVRNDAETITDFFAERDIKAYVEIESFFERREISLMLSLLSVLDNAAQDIPLISVMRSPMFSFSDDELAQLRILTGRKESFFETVNSYAYTKFGADGYKMLKGRYKYKKQPETIPSLKAKCKSFIKDIYRWRGYIRTKSVAQLIWTIYEETYFYDMMGAIEEGEESQYNLRLLYERAKNFENAGFKGLFNFIKYIEHIQSGVGGGGRDMSGAKLISENHDVVRVMTIHKSKGLEFPIVFMIKAGQNFYNKTDSTAVTLHKDFGIGLYDINYKLRYMRETAIKDFIKAMNKRELQSERMRLLYVALTRAREKLYVVAAKTEKNIKVIKEIDKNLIYDHNSDATLEEGMRAYWKALCIGGKMLPSNALAARGFYDWLCPSVLASGRTWDFDFSYFGKSEREKAEKKEDKIPEFVFDPKLKEAVYKIMDYRYPYSKGYRLPSRTSVTQLKEFDVERRLQGEPLYEPDSRSDSGADEAEILFAPLVSRPAFMREKGAKLPNEIGTLYHLVMSELNLDRIKKDGIKCIESELDRLETENKITKDDRKYINTNKIGLFFESDIGKRMLKSDEVHREAPFQINIPAYMYDPSLPHSYDDEKIILQGIIDCYFKEGENYILIDYKTDKVRGSKRGKIHEKYAKQLELYKLAIETLTEINVGESRLYLFDTAETV